MNRTSTRVALLAACILVGLAAFAVFSACSSHEDAEVEGGVKDGGSTTGDATRPKLAAAFSDPTGYGVPVVVNGQVARAAGNGDAGFLLTAVGPTSAPVFAPAPVSLPSPFIAGDFLTNDGGVAYWSTVPAGFSPSGDLDGSTSTQYVVGLEGNPIDPATCRTPSSSNRIYFDGTKWVCAAMSLTGDTTGSPSGTSTTTTVVSATGNGTSPYDAGGTAFNIAATGECLATGTNGTFCAQEAPTVFSDATTWQTIVQRAWSVNQPMHFFVLFTADDFSGDGGSITKNFVNVNLEAHAMPDTVAVLFAPQAGADFGPGPIPLAPLKNNFVTGCTTNNSDAGCTPSAGGTTGWTFQILSAVVSGTNVVQVQAKAVGTTRWPWKGHAIVNEQRSAP